MLAGPFSWQVAQARDPNTAREPSIDRRLDQGRRKKSQCDGSVMRSVFSDEKKLSIAALSQTLPERLIEQITP